MAVTVMRALSAIGGVALVLMMVHVTVDVGGRLLFNRPLFGTTEIVSAYYMVAVVFLPLAYVTRREGHILVEVFTRHLPRRTLARLEAAIGVVTTSVLCWMIWECVVAASRSTAIREKWEAGQDLLVVWPTRWLLPIGLAALALHQIMRLIADLRTAARPDADDEAPP